MHVGNDLDVLGTLEPPYDLIFYDAYVPAPPHLENFERLLADRGVLVTSNLFLGQYAPELPELADGARYREALFEHPWLTTFITSGKALSVRA